MWREEGQVEQLQDLLDIQKGPITKGWLPGVASDPAASWGSQFSSWDLLLGRFLPNLLHLAAKPHSISTQHTVPVTAHTWARAHPCPRT